MKNWFIVFAFFYFQFFFSQGSKLDLKIKDKIEYLKKNGADTIVVYSQNCVGCYPKIIKKGECVTDETKFIFWTTKGNYFTQKMDECFDYEVKEVQNSRFLRTVIKKAQQIEKAEIKKPEHKVNKDEVIASIIDHYNYYDFEFHFKNQVIEKRINDYFLEVKKIDKNMPNDNYASNQKSILKKLLDLVKQEIY